MTKLVPNLIIKDLQTQPYFETWQAMRNHVDGAQPDQADELWLVEHPPIYTLGQNGDLKHLLNPGEIPILHVDRGGQITYHGPGQLIVYFLLNLRRHNLGIRHLVSGIENSVIQMLSQWGIKAQTLPGAPGVYVDNKKVCSLGLRIRRGMSYHGLSLNVNMDLEPFSRINPCGIPDLLMTQLCDLGAPSNMESVKVALVENIKDVVIPRGKSYA